MHEKLILWKQKITPGLLAKILLPMVLLLWFGILLSQKIDLTTADLGRHITNGQIILHGDWQQKRAVLTTNFYSYTLPEQPFVNHHWLSGVLFYLIFQAGGFSGLSAFYVLLGMATLWLFWDVARRESNIYWASLAALLLLPLLAARAEVRPEMITYFFTGVVFYVLSLWRKGKIKNFWLASLPVVMLLWVNFHIGFVFGFLCLGAFGLEQLINYVRRKPNGFIPLLFWSAISTVAALINPFGYKLLIYPFQIFKNYGYLIVENQSIRFLENLGFVAGQHFLLYKLVVGLLLFGLLLVAIKNIKKVDIVLLILVLVSGVLAYVGIRNFPSFAFFALPALAYLGHCLWPEKFTQAWPKLHLAYRLGGLVLAAAVVLIIVVPQVQTLQGLGQKFGWGLLPGAQASAQFFIKQNIQGPMFNNYDIGGYVIHNLYPQTKPFTDNRPEAYTVDFFEQVYKAPQTDEAKWQALDGQYNFNAIFFSYRDYTPWAQQFLLARVKDPAWAPVYVDSYNIIFVKKNLENLPIIQKYLLPPQTFGGN